MSVVAVVGNPRHASRTHAVARAVAREVARALGEEVGPEVDLAPLGGRVLDPDDATARAATDAVLRASALVVASPTYKATYSGLLKGFLDRLGTGALAGTPAIPVLLGGAPDHRLAVDVHLTPLLLELGASVPVRGLFVLEAQLEDLDAVVAAWAAPLRRARSAPTPTAGRAG